jgi:3-hydroxybutyryl-CoA dehydratase
MNDQTTAPVVRYFDEITEGMSGEFSKTISESDVITFAEVTGDKNPIHLDAEYAESSIFGQRISHGMLVAGLISAVFGYHFPGPGWIYISQNLQFKAPVFLGDTATAVVTATKLIPEKKMIEFETIVSVDDKPVIKGTATLMSPKRPS